MSRPRLNCAIYTRKSSDEGLEQSFNSLDAQREACEAYIVSQKHEGWQVLPTAYNDGGFSGGNMDRPALQKLLGDIEAGKINIVVVYKVDRLTRSLADFAKIVEQFDRQGISFVSVTQQFNTTSSMGRLTLNVLLSFAQFEREVTGERIRDKIAASKKKGMWMGGTVPLGYVSRDRTLIPVPEEVKKVRHIYERYLVLGSVRELQAELKRDGILSKYHVSKTGIKHGNRHFSRGALYELLQNPLYIGLIRHRKETHPGRHEGIVPEKLWQAVQKKLADNRLEHPGQKFTGQSLLAGLLFDAKGERLTPSSTIKNGRRYRYYVLASTTRIKTDAKLRLPAGELEKLVIDKLLAHLEKHECAPDIRGTLEAEDMLFRKSALMRLIEKITVYAERVAISLKDGDNLLITYCFSMPGPYRQLLSGHQPPMASEHQKQALLKAFLQGYVWRETFFEGRTSTIAAIAREAGKSEIHVARLINFSLMGPDLAAQILKGGVPAHLTQRSIINDLPVSWVEQHLQLERA